MQRYERGVPTNLLMSLGAATRRGTRVEFLPDPSIFVQSWIDPGAIGRRLRELSFLLPGLTLRFTDRREHQFREPLGLAALVNGRLGGSGPERQLPTFEINETSAGIRVEIAASWGPTWAGSIESFANVHRTTGGGTHVRGLVSGLVGGMRKVLPNPPRRSRSIERAVTAGLVAVVCVRLDDPTYESPTKSILSTARVAKVVRDVVGRSFASFLARESSLLAHLIAQLPSSA